MWNLRVLWTRWSLQPSSQAWGVSRENRFNFLQTNTGRYQTYALKRNCPSRHQAREYIRNKRLHTQDWWLWICNAKEESKKIFRNSFIQLSWNESVQRIWLFCRRPLVSRSTFVHTCFWFPTIWKSKFWGQSLLDAPDIRIWRILGIHWKILKE